MGTVDDTLFELKLTLDRTIKWMMGGRYSDGGRIRYCRACGTRNRENAEKCTRCGRLFKYDK